MHLFFIREILSDFKALLVWGLNLISHVALLLVFKISYHLNFSYHGRAFRASLLSVHWHHGVLELVNNPSSQIHMFKSQPGPPESSVQALASALVPVAVNHEGYDDEKEETQHGEEHSEKDSDVAHSLSVLIACEGKEENLKIHKSHSVFTTSLIYIYTIPSKGKTMSEILH